MPLLGVSATLDITTLENIKPAAGFDNDVLLDRNSIDRPEIFIEINAIKYDQNSMLDLQFLLPPNITQPQDIPKIVVYMQDVKSLQTGVRLIRQWITEYDAR